MSPSRWSLCQRRFVAAARSVHITLIEPNLAWPCPVQLSSVHLVQTEQAFKSNIQLNCALCDESTKRGIQVHFFETWKLIFVKAFKVKGHFVQYDCKRWPRYSVYAVNALCDLVTLVFDLTFWPYGHTWWVTWPTPCTIKTIPKPIRFSSSCFTIDKASAATACAVTHDLCVRSNFSHIFENPDPTCLYLHGYMIKTSQK